MRELPKKRINDDTCHDAGAHGKLLYGICVREVLHYRSQFVLALLLGLLLTGCKGLEFTWSPVAAAEQGLRPPRGVSQEYVLQSAPGRTLVLFRRAEVSEGGLFPHVTFGYALVEFGVKGWEAKHTAVMGKVAFNDVECLAGPLARTERKDQTIVAGLVRNANISMVIVTFENGERVAGSVENGLFAVVSSALLVRPSRLRTLDSTGGEIEDFDLSIERPPPPCALSPELPGDPSLQLP